ncbi:MAG: hypothetical protein U0559_04830 [Anaerolineae bacterium]
MFNILPREFFLAGLRALYDPDNLWLPLRRRVFHLLYIGSLAASVIGIWSDIEHDRVYRYAAATPIEAILQVVLNELLGLFVPIAAGVAGFMLLLRVLLGFLIEEDFARVTERLRCVTGSIESEALTAFVRRERYMHRGMWTLAALHLQRRQLAAHRRRLSTGAG